jgi:acyl dehydratase
MTDTYLEDVKVGTVLEFGSKTLNKEEIIDFATKYDPQPFHIDENAAADSIYGGLIASGWHTGSIAMRMMVDHMVSGRAALGSPGFNNLKFRKPVRPGDTLRVRSEVVDVKRSRSRPNMGTIFGLLQVINQKDEVVLSFESLGMILARTNGEDDSKT